MCTFNIALDDKIVNTARKSFADDQALTAWMQQQITVLLSNYVSAPDGESTRKPHKHDSLMGVISNVSDVYTRPLEKLSPVLQKLCGICSVKEDDLNGDEARKEALKTI